MQDSNIQPNQNISQNPNPKSDFLSFTPIGGIGDVTKNMYLYEYGNEILIIDCGLGFADENMPGVDLTIPDISYLKSTNKKIVGMVLTHGHEDHIGALPFILPSLPNFPIYGSTLTSALASEKLEEFGIKNRVQTVSFDQNVRLGSFNISFVRVTHSIIDAANLFIRTPVGNFYHASDYKFDFTPVDGKPTEISKIAKAGEEGVLCLLSDCLGAERPGNTPSEKMIYKSFEEEFKNTKGRIFVTTYSSNISRLNQAIEVALKLGRKICFMGGSLLKSRDVGKSLNYMKYPRNFEVRPHQVKKMNPSQVLILVAGSQGQKESALTRIANGENKDIKIQKGDTVIFSADAIPGNERSVNALVDMLAKQGAKVVYSNITDEFHVSGHGSQLDIQLLVSLTRPKYLLPISGTYRQMIAYREIAESMGYQESKVILIENGQRVNFDKAGYTFGKKIQFSNIFVDEITSKAVENYILVDRTKISKEGLIIVIAEINSATGQLIGTPDILTRGFVYERKRELASKITTSLNKTLSNRNGQVTDWGYYRKTIEKITEDLLFREGRRPLVVPVVLEV